MKFDKIFFSSFIPGYQSYQLPASSRLPVIRHQSTNRQSPVTNHSSSIYPSNHPSSLSHHFTQPNNHNVSYIVLLLHFTTERIKENQVIQSSIIPVLYLTLRTWVPHIIISRSKTFTNTVLLFYYDTISKFCHPTSCTFIYI